jgi:hypothetical protein
MRNLDLNNNNNKKGLWEEAGWLEEGGR